MTAAHGPLVEEEHRPIAGEEGQAHELRRTLTGFHLILLGVGAIIGAGIFVVTGTAAAQHAGPAILLSFILAGVGCLFAGLCYAEFASMIPVAGSAYTYGYATLGEVVAWLIGWDLSHYLCAAASVAVGWSGYFTAFVRDFLHLQIASTGERPLRHRAGSHVRTGASVLLVAVMTGLLVVGIHESARLNNLIVFLKVGVVLLVILFGVAYVEPGNWKPFIPENTGTFGQFGWSGILSGAGVIFFAYIGFDAVSTAAQETRNPQKDARGHPGLARRLHRAVHAHGAGDDGPGALQHPQRSEPVYVAMTTARRCPGCGPSSPWGPSPGWPRWCSSC